MSFEVGQERSLIPLTPWELSKLLEPMHRWKRPKRGKRPVPWRPHFLPILAFVYRNRFAVASQIQRRFSTALPSDRTARRHLAELEATGCVSVADTRSTSPLFPKVYFVTGRGVRKIEESLRERGKPGQCCSRDRRRPEAYSPDHVLHEILTTEFLLNVWKTAEQRDDLELLVVQRRALERHRAFLVDGPHRTRLKPDALFLYRQSGGLMCCFLEMDNGTMNPRQMYDKFVRYQTWSRSDVGGSYLINLYRSNGADVPRPLFRVLMVIGDRPGGNADRRLTRLRKICGGLDGELGNRFWFTTISELKHQQGRNVEIVGSAIWEVGGVSSIKNAINKRSLFAVP